MSLKNKWLCSGLAVAVFALGVGYQLMSGREAVAKSGMTQQAASSSGQLAHAETASNLAPTQLAPAITGKTWINSEPVDFKSLRGKVVVVDFWTFACYNCKNTIPYFKAWDQKYRSQGLVTLGVHTPELSFEKDIDNVRKAVKDYGVTYPVVIDGDYANWNRYGVWAWPTWFILDKKGYVRYVHIGEGDYDSSEKMIQKLLAE